MTKADSLIKDLLRAIDAKNRLLTAYRLQRAPSETLLKQLDRATKTVERATAYLNSKSS